MSNKTVILGRRYELLNRFEDGNFFEFYKAKDCYKNQTSQVRVLKQRISEDKDFTVELLKYAQPASWMDHPNIVAIKDADCDNGVYYIVTEPVEGISLATYISRKGKLSPKETISITVQILSGVQVAHEKQMINCMISPQNIMITKDGKVMVGGFGIGKAIHAYEENTSKVKGSHYMAPEYTKTLQLNEQSDIYSIGVTMYEMVTGKLPFDEASIIFELSKLPYSLRSIIVKSAHKNPEDRYTNCREFIVDLRRSLVEPEGDFVTMYSDLRKEGTTQSVLEHLKNNESIVRKYTYNLYHNHNTHRASYSNLLSSGKCDDLELITKDGIDLKSPDLDTLKLNEYLKNLCLQHERYDPWR
jgi:serine/threonine-protein kinase